MDNSIQSEHSYKMLHQQWISNPLTKDLVEVLKKQINDSLVLAENYASNGSEVAMLNSRKLLIESTTLRKVLNLIHTQKYA